MGLEGGRMRGCKVRWSVIDQPGVQGYVLEEKVK